MKFTYRDIPITYKGISEMIHDIYGESKHFSKDILLRRFRSHEKTKR